MEDDDVGGMSKSSSWSCFAPPVADHLSVSERQASFVASIVFNFADLMSAGRYSAVIKIK